ncbi:MAG: ABC transporter permease subunit [Chloroflexota bacterium]
MSAAAATGRLLPSLPRSAWIVLLSAVTAILWIAFAGQYTLPHDNDAATFETINDIREWIDANRNSNIILVVFVTGIRTLITAIFNVFLAVLQGLTWPGLITITAALGLVIGGLRLAALTGLGVLAFGVLGLWNASVDTLALTFTAVLLSLAIGIPLGIVAGRNDRFLAAIQPILDTMQIMPTFAYLAPFALFFLIGPATAAIVTMIYSVPPAIRITALGIRSVAPATVEAATSMGSTARQLLAKVQLPMARQTIVLGINQTIMMALSMVVITALVDAPGLGKDIIRSFQKNDVGQAFDAGLAIVIMAIILDRLTSRASERVDPARRATRPTPPGQTRRFAIVGLVASIVAVAIGTFVLGGGDFPDEIRFTFRGPVNDVTGWVTFNFYFLTEAIKNGVSYGLLNPLQTILTSAPWWLVVATIGGIAFLLSGLRPAVIAIVCLLVTIRIELWQHSMETLTMVLVATGLTLVIGGAFGVLSARSDRFAAFLRPLLDGAQTLPAFVYLVPAVALFGPTRFTGIVAAIIYAIPPVIRLVEIGIRTVPVAVIEAATAAGSTPRQLLWKVQLPMARPALLVAANQGIILVLAMVVVGGLVGAQALGYDVVAGFARRDFFGEGLAAGIAIVLLGIMLDRITQGAGTRQSTAEARPAVARRGA